MGEKEFVELAKKEVIKLYNKDHKSDHSKEIEEDELYVVWLVKVLQNNKALISTSRVDDLYFEATYNGDKEELYVDAYKKLSNTCIFTK